MFSQAGGRGCAGGGTRTHKGLRPEICGTSAFTIFATPALDRLRTMASTTPRRGVSQTLPSRSVNIALRTHALVTQTTHDGSFSRSTPVRPGARAGERLTGIGSFYLLANHSPWRDCSNGAERSGASASSEPPRRWKLPVGHWTFPFPLLVARSSLPSAHRTCHSDCG